MRIRQQYSMTDPAFLRQEDALPQKGMGPVNHQIPLLISQRLTLFPDFCLPTKLQVGSVLNRVFLSVSLSVCSQGGPHVTTTHNTIDQSEDIHVGNFPLPAPPRPPANLRNWDPSTPRHRLEIEQMEFYWNAFLSFFLYKNPTIATLVHDPLCYTRGTP